MPGAEKDNVMRFKFAKNVGNSIGVIFSGSGNENKINFSLSMDHPLWRFLLSL